LESQTDEGEFGFTYSQADEVIYGLYEQKKSIPELVKHGIGLKTIAKIQNWIKKLSFKRKAPYVIRKP
jgi:NAD+ synthase